MFIICPEPPPTLDGANILKSHLRHDEILRKDGDDKGGDYERDKNDKENDSAKNERNQMLAGIPEPAEAEHDSRTRAGNEDKNGHHGRSKQKLPHKVAKSRTPPIAPESTDVTFSCHHAVEEHESHHTADVHQPDQQSHAGEDQDDYRDYDQHALRWYELRQEILGVWVRSWK